MEVNILDYGAVADGVTNNQAMIQAAIDDCTKAGGRVIVPAGTFLSGTIQLKSQIDLHLEKGSILVASQDPAHIRHFEADATVDGFASGCFLYACHAENITISGEGTIDGQGRKVYFEDPAQGEFDECPLSVTGFRPRTTYLEDVIGLTVKEVTFHDSCFWTLHMAGCRHVVVDGIKIFNNDRGPNNDGIDPDGCQDVVIRNCLVETGDDAIVLKATQPIWKKYGHCENIIITGCILHSRDSALKIGTETYGDVRNVVFSDCIVKDCSRALGIWVRDGGTIENISMHHIIGTTKRYADNALSQGAARWWGKGEPIFLSATYRKEKNDFPGKIQHITIENCRLTCESSLFIAGEKKAPITDITLRNNAFTWRQQGKRIPNVFDEQPSLRDVYLHDIPWLYARHVTGLVVEGSYDIDATMQKTVGQEEILETCRNVKIVRK